MRNLVSIGQTVAEILRFFDFSRLWPSAIFFLQIQISNGLWGYEGQCASRAKFCGDRSNRCWVIALLLLLRFVTLWPWPLTLDTGHTWQVAWLTRVPSLKILHLSVLELLWSPYVIGQTIIFSCCGLLWSRYGIGQTIIFSCCGLFFLLLFFFPRLISATADWMSAILPHMVWP